MYKNLYRYLCIVVKPIHVVQHCTNLFRGGKTSSLISNPQSSVTGGAVIVIKRYSLVETFYIEIIRKYDRNLGLKIVTVCRLLWFPALTTNRLSFWVSGSTYLGKHLNG